MIWVLGLGFVVEIVAFGILCFLVHEYIGRKDELDALTSSLVYERQRLAHDVFEFKESKKKAGNSKKLRTKSNKDGNDAAKAAFGSLDPDLIAALSARDPA